MPGNDGSWLRPDVVWFGECLREEALTAAASVLTWCDLFLVFGTSAVAYPAAPRSGSDDLVLVEERILR